MENHPSEEAKYEQNGESGRSTVTRGGKQKQNCRENTSWVGPRPDERRWNQKANRGKLNQVHSAGSKKLTQIQLWKSKL
jgi:hypothetical protein